MSRLTRFVHTVTSGYAQLVASMLYQLASIPLALRFLSREEFGLWVLMTQIAGYLLLVDFGITSAVARLLINCKDQRDGGKYGSMLQTGWLVFVIQALIILFLGIGLSSQLMGALRISPAFHTTFPILIRWLCIFQALILITRVLPQVFYAHQRYDVVNYSAIAQQPVSFVILWISLRAGQGVYSYLWPLGVSWAMDMVILGTSCLRLGLLPRRGAWGRPSWLLFRELFDFGKDSFLVSVGLQLMMASQTFIITRNLGLSAAATWSICTKAYSLIYLLLWRIVDFSIPAFSEMITRGERDQLRRRWRDLTMFVGALAGVAAVVFAVCNQPFVTVWTHGRISWPVRNDVLLAGWIMANTLAHCHCSFVPATGTIGAMRYVYFIEGAVFVVLASLGSQVGGMTAIIAASIICTIGISGLYGIYHTAKYCQFPLREVAVSWQRPMARIVVLLAPVALVAWWLSRTWPPLAVFPFNAAIAGISGGYLLLRYGIPPTLQTDIFRSLPARVQPLFRRWLAWT
ncbi:MAG: oligosaccharide flippase family protein [Verrucomicrobiia bacterium]